MSQKRQNKNKKTNKKQLNARQKCQKSENVPKCSKCSPLLRLAVRSFPGSSVHPICNGLGVGGLGRTVSLPRRRFPCNLSDYLKIKRREILGVSARLKVINQ